jgi:hypothetical protein
MTYAIEIQYASGRTDSIPLSATSEKAAVQQLQRYLSQQQPRSGTPIAQAKIYLSFFRAHDGQHGYLNPTGAAPTGSPWN